MTSEEWAATRTVLDRWDCPDHRSGQSQCCDQSFPVYEHRRTT